MHLQRRSPVLNKTEPPRASGQTRRGPLSASSFQFIPGTGSDTDPAKTSCASTMRP